MVDKLCVLFLNLGCLLLCQLFNSQFLQIELLQNLTKCFKFFHGFTFGSTPETIVSNLNICRNKSKYFLKSVTVIW